MKHFCALYDANFAQRCELGDSNLCIAILDPLPESLQSNRILARNALCGCKCLDCLRDQESDRNIK